MEASHKCMLCEKNYSCSSALNRHIRDIHKESTASLRISRTIKCPLCDFSVIKNEELLRHIEVEHEINLLHEIHEFQSKTEFEEWKLKIERETRSKYVQHRGEQKHKHGTTVKYYCNRTGFYKTKGSGKRFLKSKGSSKINSNCPSQMHRVLKPDGSCFVNYIGTHIGHRLELGHLTLPDEDKKWISKQLLDGVGVGKILDKVRDSISGDNTERIHLLTRKDITNIASAVRHKNVAVSVDSLVQEACESEPGAEETVECNGLSIDCSGLWPETETSSHNSEFVNVDKNKKFYKLQASLLREAELIIHKIHQMNSIEQLKEARNILKPVQNSFDVLLSGASN